MRMTLKVLAALLDYPSADVTAAVPELRAALAAERALPAEAIRALEPLLAGLASRPLLDVQADHGETFEGSRARSLHLFEHVHGESRDRGAALVDLAAEYHRHGFAIAAKELPDFLPLFLEFVSLLPPHEAKDWLARPAHVYAAMHERLEAIGSPYAPVLGALRALPGSAKVDPQAVADLRAQMRDEETRSVDERWEEAQVSFAAPAPVPARTGVVARIQARLKR